MADDRRLHEAGGPDGGTRGGYIDSFENMPGAQHQPFGSSPPRAFVPTIGCTVRIAPGTEADWLPAGDTAAGEVVDLVAGPLHESSLVVRLDRIIDAVGRTGRRVRGSFVVVEPAGTPGRWARSGQAHVEVWSEEPGAEPWLDRADGVWVDAAADYELG